MWIFIVIIIIGVAYLAIVSGISLSGPSATKNIAFVCEMKSDDMITITNHGGNDVSQLDKIQVNDGDGNILQSWTDDYNNPSDSFSVSLHKNRRLVLIGKCIDGTTSVLLDRTY